MLSKNMPNKFNSSRIFAGFWFVLKRKIFIIILAYYLFVINMAGDVTKAVVLLYQVEDSFKPVVSYKVSAYFSFLPFLHVLFYLIFTIRTFTHFIVASTYSYIFVGFGRT